jgi:hypothetical protein
LMICLFARIDSVQNLYQPDPMEVLG